MILLNISKKINIFVIMKKYFLILIIMVSSLFTNGQNIRKPIVQGTFYPNNEIES